MWHPDGRVLRGCAALASANAAVPRRRRGIPGHGVSDHSPGLYAERLQSLPAVPEWLPQEFEFLRENLKGPVAAGDAELLGEFVDCLRAFGLPESDAVVRSGVEYLLASQNADGSWGDVHEPTCTSGITLRGPRSTGFGITPGVTVRIGRRGCKRY